MQFRRGLLMTLAASVFMGACATTSTTTGPITSPTGKVYPAGYRPVENKQTQAALLFLAQADGADETRAPALYQQALAEAQRAIEADTLNPTGYFLAGSAQVGLDNYAAADELWRRAETLYPAYEIEVEPERERAWGRAFNQGVIAFNANDVATARAAWERANVIFGMRPEAYQNLAIVYSQADETDAAIDAYQAALVAADAKLATRELTPDELVERTDARKEVLNNLGRLLVAEERFQEAETILRQAMQNDPANVSVQAELAAVLARQNRAAEADAIYEQLLARQDLSTSDVFDVGVALFNSKNFPRAAEAFRRVTELSPNNRDAWFNYANALYAQEKYAELIPVGERVTMMDPLNQDASLILARAYRDTDQRQKVLDLLGRIEKFPVLVDRLQLRTADGRSMLRGTVQGNAAAPGTPVRLQFTFYGPEGTLGTETVTVSAPRKGEETSLELTFENPTPPIGYSYQVMR